MKMIRKKSFKIILYLFMLQSIHAIGVLIVPFENVIVWDRYVENKNVMIVDASLLYSAIG